jgi:crotonobetainyl-CoA:carnitine CoA-transferase CaiB-like acyl-CoA transferase
MAHWPPLVGDVAATYVAINRGKEIRSLDLKSQEGRAELLELAKTADVVLDGFRPGVLDKLGVGYRVLAELNPKIVLCSISGYGQNGPLAMRAGHDLNYQALAGVLSISGGESASPPLPQLQVADTAAGSYGAAMLILAALLERQRTGRGRHVDVSMSEQLLPLMSTLFAASQAQVSDPRRDGELLSGGAPCYRIYRTQDGRHLSVGALEPKFWQQVLEVVQRPELAHCNHLGGDGADEAVGVLTQVIGSKTLAEWGEIFGRQDACVEPVLTFAEVRQLPHWQARQSFERVTAPNGESIEVPKMPGSLAGMGCSSDK